MSTYFISDLHLHASRPFITEQFLLFLKNITHHAKALYILGDFFEVWIGDDLENPHDEKVMCALLEFTTSKIPIYFMHGNRDFLIASQFAKKTGCQLIQDPHVLELNQHRIVLAHGDALCTLDTLYQSFRQWVRHPIIKFLFLSLPLFLRKRIAQSLRNKSMRNSAALESIHHQPHPNPVANTKADTSNKNFYDNPKFDVTFDAVKELLINYNATILIHGHTHKPAVHEFEMNGRLMKRIVLGDWQNDSSMILEVNHNIFNLKNIAIRNH